MDKPVRTRAAIGLEPRRCIVCGTEFQPYRDYQIACRNRSCREKARASSPRLAPVVLDCKDCGAEFTAQWSGMGKRPPSCPECMKIKNAGWQEQKNRARRLGTATDPEQRREVNLRNTLRKYGITIEDYRAMFAAQGGRCAICGEQATGGVKAAARLHVDHDHVTGLNRSLLCGRCNQGVGFFRDDPKLLRLAAEYIERHREKVGDHGTS